MFVFLGLFAISLFRYKLLYYWDIPYYQEEEEVRAGSIGNLITSLDLCMKPWLPRCGAVDPWSERDLWDQREHVWSATSVGACFMMVFRTLLDQSRCVRGISVEQARSVGSGHVLHASFRVWKRHGVVAL